MGLLRAQIFVCFGKRKSVIRCPLKSTKMSHIYRSDNKNSNYISTLFDSSHSEHSILAAIAIGAHTRALETSPFGRSAFRGQTRIRPETFTFNGDREPECSEWW